MAKRRRFTPEFKAEAVRLVLDEKMARAEVARDLGISESSIGRWVQQAEVDRGQGADGELTSDDKDELRRLRQENRRLKMERDILKKAAAFFAKESL
jgi:transposase-like protein